MSARWLLVINDPPPYTGASVVSQKFASDLREEGREHRIIDVVSSQDPRQALLPDLVAGLRAAAAVLSKRFDICYIQGMDGSRLASTLLVAVACKLVGIPMHFHHHSYQLATNPHPIAKMLFAPFLGVRHLVLSAGMGAAIEQTYGADSYTVASNAAAVRSMFHEVSRVETPGILHLAFVGKGGIGKGEDFCVEIAREISQSQPCRLTIAGLGHSHHGVVTGDQLAVNYVGVQTVEELAHLYASCDVLLLPSAYATEAAPLVIFEAIAAGARVVASDVGLIPEVVADLGRAISVAGFETGQWVEEILQELPIRPAVRPHPETFAGTIRSIEDAGNSVFLEMHGVHS